MHEYEYPRPAVTVDVVAVANPTWGERRLLTVRRKNEPFKGMLALPGGFIDPDEEPAYAAGRELYEETGLDIRHEEGCLRLLGVFGRPGRDPRGWTISVVYALTWIGSMDEIRAGDDAAAVQWVDISKRAPQMAFDHRRIVDAWLQGR